MLARALLEENRTSGRAHESGPVGLGLEKGKSLGAAGFPQYLTFFAHRTTRSLNKRAAAGFREPCGASVARSRSVGAGGSGTMPCCRNMTLHHTGRKQEIEQTRRMPTDKALRHVSASPTETIGPHRRATHSDQSVPGLGDPRSGQAILSAAYVERRSGERRPSRLYGVRGQGWALFDFCPIKGGNYSPVRMGVRNEEVCVLGSLPVPRRFSK
jgi:hypothetical protein